MTATVEELVLVAERMMGWQQITEHEFCRSPGGCQPGTFCIAYQRDGRESVAPADLDTDDWNPLDSDADMAGLLRKLMEKYDVSIISAGGEAAVYIYGCLLGSAPLAAARAPAPELRDAVWLAALAVAKEQYEAHATIEPAMQP